MMFQPITVLIRRRMLDEIESYTGDARLVVLPPPCPQPVEPLDFTRADDLIVWARAAARDYLDAPAGRRAGAGPPPAPPPSLEGAADATG